MLPGVFVVMLIWLRLGSWLGSWLGYWRELSCMSPMTRHC